MTTPTLPTLRFKNDGPMRKRLFVPDAFAHPAKGHIAMWQEMVERYSKEGETILDPMAGIGTSLVAALMGRSVYLVELEAHFVDPMRRSWEKMRNMPMLGYTMGTATIIQGDARHLGDGLADCVVTSPPYERQLHPNSDPPFEEIPWTDPKRVGKSPHSQVRASTGYTRRPVDAIVTSPPFQDQEPNHLGGDTDFSQVGGIRHARVVHYGIGDNIGNLRNAAYWDAMRQVYAECYRVLRPGGIMALVLKGFTRDGKYVDLPGQTEALLLDAGWQKHDHWLRELWSLSFWRILQKRRDPSAFDNRLMYEEVLAFKKPEGEGKGVDAVLTSPPYEGNLVLEQNGIDEAKLKQPYGPNSQFARPQTYTRPSAIITSPPYEGSAVADLNASPLNGPIGDASRAKDRRKGGQERLDKFGTGYTK